MFRQDKVIVLARKAGFLTGRLDYPGTSEALVRPLVGDNCITELTNFAQACYDVGAKDENEACAKVCADKAAKLYERNARWQHHTGAAVGCDACASAIRERRK